MTGWTKVPLIIICSVFLLLVSCIEESHGILSCYKCGQYNDGVGSITPCINSTAQMHLQECPTSAKWCIKYVSEVSTVRDCVNSCVEKEVWGTRTYCCQNDGCNRGGPSLCSGTALWLTAIVLSLLIAGQLHG
ncbi:uncharacterized protein LOC107036798 [Diachasma alloeum]|uniref:uncharacterized protein LOC107036798 n=1 Tax=Diachasma alloeum TaxID=454923 RepID=UPI00073835DE|nr:uncharacterized protein LOC107036798 [Diachasma alloeum]